MDYSKLPINLDKVDQNDLDKEILRAAIWVELDTINLYEQFLVVSKNENLNKVIEDVTKEEKTHTGEFLNMLYAIDPEQVQEMKKSREEVSKLTGVEIPEP